MDDRMRSSDPPELVVKNRNSSGCLIVRKKGGNGVGGSPASGSRRLFGSKEEKKRPRLVLSDFGSSDELLVPSRRRVAPVTIRVCNGLKFSENCTLEESEIGGKRDREEYYRLHEVGRNGEGQSERKRDRSDGSVRSYFALPPDYQDRPQQLPRPMLNVPEMGGCGRWPPIAPMSLGGFWNGRDSWDPMVGPGEGSSKRKYRAEAERHNQFFNPQWVSDGAWPGPFLGGSK